MNTKNGGRRSSGSTSSKGKMPFAKKSTAPVKKAGPGVKKASPVSSTRKPAAASADPTVEKPKKEVTARDKRKYIDFKIKQKKGDPLPNFNENEQRLNKYLSNAGVCSRREADVLISTGLVSINGTIITEMGYKLKPGDVVKYDGGTINAEKKRYVLLNKPKGYITTMDDPLGRKTVMSLVKKACRERIYPIGRMERDTVGLLMFTNDGDLFKKLTHTSFKASRIYQVELNKPVKKEDLGKLIAGLDLEDGKTAFDEAEFVRDGSSREIGVKLHSGKNQVVKRMFEALGYTVVKLDRVQYAGLDKKDLPRGMFRNLTEKEVAFLKMS